MRKENTLCELIAMLVGIFVYVGFRDVTVGADTATYVRWMTEVNNDKLYNELHAKGVEIGYLTFCRFLGYVCPYGHSILIVQSLLATASIGYFTKQYCQKDYFLSLLLFLSFGLFAFHLTGIRQSMAMSLCLFSFCFADKNKIYKASIIYIIALSFHKSAIVFLLSFIFIFIWKRRNNIWSTIFLSLLLILYVPVTLSYAASMFERWEMYSKVEETGNGYVMFFIIFLVTLFGEFYIKKKDVRYEHFCRGNYLNLIIWSGRLVTRTFERPVLYSLPFLMPVFTNSIYCINDNRIRSLYKAFSVILLSAFFMYRYASFHYKFCF